MEINIEVFPSVFGSNEEIVSLIIEYLTIKEKIEKYFPLLNTAQYDWIRNLFALSGIFSFILNEEVLVSLCADH